MNYVSTHKLKSFFVIFFSFLLFVAIAKSKSKEVVYVPYTGDVDSFILKLEEEGFLQNSFARIVLQTILTLRGAPEPGNYALSRGMGAVSTVIALEEPEYKYISILDGLRKGQIAQILGRKLNWEPEKIDAFSELYPVCPLIGQEGYLASGTYLIHTEEETHIVEKTMQQTFTEVLDELGLKKEDVSIPKIIIIASLIQREAAGKADMRLISGIIYNRLKVDMPLQIDATLQYVTGTKDQWWPVPTPEDKKIESLFNTYQNLGLPPTPIATPSKDAIRAALNPIKTDCLFYIHDNRRNIHCATNYDQHKRNIRYYLK